jgi:hypothetical protein
VRDEDSKISNVPKVSPLVVCLEPLSRLQVERYAQAKIISDVPQFIKALE